MRTAFSPDDEDAFFHARDEILGRFEASSRGGAAAASDVALALDWKWGYGDGDIATWSLDDVDDFLLDWCPRKVSMPAREAATLPGSLGAFVAFLDDEGILGSRSTPAARLRLHLSDMADEVVAAMDDRSRFGMAKSLFAGTADLGDGAGPDDDTVLDDPAALQAFIDRFNSLPFDERGRILGLGGPRRSPWQALTDGIELPPAPVVDREDLVRMAEAAPVVARVRTVREFLGDGRKLTAKGNLTVADARALAALLDDEALADQARWGRAIRSADDLPTTQFVLRWARAAGAVRVAKGRMMATASWRKLDAPAEAGRCVAALLDKGPTTLHSAGNGWRGGALGELIDEGAVHLLAALWVVPDGIEFEDVLDVTREICERHLTFGVPTDVRERWIRWEVDRLFDLLGDAGVVARNDTEATPSSSGFGEDRVGGVLELTPLGRAVLGPYLSSHGYPVPQAGELASQPLAELFARLTAWHPERCRVEFDHWVARHSPEAAAEAMAVLLADYQDPQWAVAAVDFAGRLGAPHDERAVRRLLDTPARGHAIGWLTERGAPDVPHDRAAGLRAVVEVMSMHADGEDEDFLGLLDPIDDVGAFIEEVWRLPIPAAAVVLDAIGRVHPDRVTAKAARKGALRQRSHAANTRP